MPHRALLSGLLFFIALPFFTVAQDSSAWSRKKNFPSNAIDKATAFAVGGKGYAGFGVSIASYQKDFWQYDVITDTWKPISGFPGEPRISAVSFAIGNKGYVGTGQAGFQGMREGTRDFWEYDPETKLWTQKADFAGEIRYGAVAFSVRDKGYIGLGKNKNSVYDDLWEYDPAKNEWSQKAKFPDGGREDAVAFEIAGEGYVTLGQKRGISASQKDCWKFDPRKNEWKAVTDFPGPARVGAIAFAYKHKGYVACGFNGTFKRYSDMWEYDSYTNTWLQLSDVPFGPKAYIFSFVAGSKVFVGTCEGAKGESGFEVWAYDLSFDKKNRDTYSLGGSLLLGENRIPLAAVEAKLVDRKGEVVKTVSTGLFGSFLLLDLPNKEEYTLSVEITDPQWRTENIYLVNRENETIAVLNADNEFRYTLAVQEKNSLQLFKIDSKDIRMDMSGKLMISGKSNLPFSNANISLVNDQDQIMQQSLTDKDGKFIFDYLPADTAFYLSINQNSTKSLPKGSMLLLMDDQENIIDRSSTINPGFTLSNIPPKYNKLSKLYMEDPWLETALGKFSGRKLVIEKVYFDLAKWNLEPAAKAILNKVIIVMKNNNALLLEITAHTDSRGDEKSNLILSNKRADAAKIYMVSQGISEKRIIAKGLGESTLLNHCKNDVQCTEEEHAKNRRMEFNVKKSQ